LTNFRKGNLNWLTNWLLLFKKGVTYSYSTGKTLHEKMMNKNINMKTIINTEPKV